MDTPAGQTLQNTASISQAQAAMLDAWAQQPAMLDRAALEWCLADAFHPGCEVAWSIRHATLFRTPSRILRRPADQPEPDLGPVLTPELALSPDGPLHGQGPGSLTRWMGLPWQADTAFCRSGHDATHAPLCPRSGRPGCRIRCSRRSRTPC